MMITNRQSWLLTFATLLHSSLSASIVNSLPADASADYVIVGGGLGGLVLANRLSASGSSVIVIEAGPDAENEELINDPYQLLTLSVSGTYDWQWPTTKQSAGGSVQSISGGKVLGGSTSINGMEWTRAQANQYDAIAELNSDPSWSFQSLLASMKKAEKFYKPTALQTSQGAAYIPSAHGYHGPVSSGYLTPNYGYEFYRIFTKAARSFFGYGGGDLVSGNANIGAQNAFSVHPSPQTSKSRRSSSAVSYLYPLTSTPTRNLLTVLPNHQATKILWGANSRGLAQAKGVEYAVNALAPRRTVRANKEVIVCAGAIMSPAFLQLSGVGDPAKLSALGIESVVDLPAVGTNLQDQALNAISYTPSPAALLSPAYVGAPQIGGGSLNFPSLVQLVGKAKAGKLIADLKRTVTSRATAIVNRGGAVSVSGLAKVFKSQIKVIEQGAPIAEISATALASLLSSLVWNLLPQTRGTVHIASSDPFIYPSIDPAYLAEPFDRAVQVATAKSARAIFGTPELASSAIEEASPSMLVVPTNATDAQWETWVTTTYAPVNHPVGTAPMLPREDGGAVDTKLRLYGTKNVRVVDASVIPVQLSAHLTSTLYGIAEKAAELILQGV